MYISFVVPSAFNGLEIPISIAEGYFFCCFFVLLVENLGNSMNTYLVTTFLFHSLMYISLLLFKKVAQKQLLK